MFIARQPSENNSSAGARYVSALAIPLLRSLDSHQRSGSINISSLRDVDRCACLAACLHARGVRTEGSDLPPASAICWKCYNSETCDAQVCDLHKVIHRKCGTRWRGRTPNECLGEPSLTVGLVPDVIVPTNSLQHSSTGDLEAISQRRQSLPLACFPGSGAATPIRRTNHRSQSSEPDSARRAPR